MHNDMSDIVDNVLGLKKKKHEEYTPSILNAAQQQIQPNDAKSATITALQSGADPKALVAAKQQLGEKDYIGLCERFVEQVTKGATGLFASAKDAFNGQPDQAQTDFSKIKPGDAIYFAPDQSNGGNGHTGIYSGNGKFISATNNGIQEHDIGQWIKSTGQQPVGFVPNQGGQG